MSFSISTGSSTVQIFLSQSIVELAIKALVVVLVAIFGFLLARGIYKEIETREKMEKLTNQLIEANEDLRRMERQKTEFVSIASHQLRTPLTAIKGYASMLLEGSFGKLSDGTKDAIEKIYRSSQVLVVIIEDFLLVSRIEQKRMRYEFIAMDIRKIVEDIVQGLGEEAQEKGLSLVLKIEDGSDLEVSVDESKIKQVLHNVIGNAIKYTEKGSVNVSVSKNKVNGRVKISVVDTGIGVDKSMIPKMFVKFSKGKKSKLGSGIGLYVAKEIVRAHKGHIWAESEGEGLGAAFFVELDGAVKNI